MRMTEQEVKSHHPHKSFNRRQFVLTSIGTGFAAAVLPVGAQTIHTESTGLEAGQVKIPVADGEIPAYRAQPAKGSHFPTVLVVQEIFGVHEHIQDLCRRLAKVGYLAVAPALYARQGDPTKYSAIPDLIKNIVSKVPDEEVLSDLDATAKWAAAHGGNPDKLAITGFCWGGRIVWLYAAHNPKLKAAAAWYGPLESPNDELHPHAPVELAGELKAPVLGQYGGLDQGITADAIEHMRRALDAAKGPASESTIIVYPDAQHGFNADYRPSYNATDAKTGWERMLAWFAKNGVG